MKLIVTFSYLENSRKGPKAREPSKCLNLQSYRQKLAKEAF